MLFNKFINGIRNLIKYSTKLLIRWWYEIPFVQSRRGFHSAAVCYRIRTRLVCWQLREIKPQHNETCTRKTNSLSCVHKVCNSSINLTDSVKDLRVLVDKKTFSLKKNIHFLPTLKYGRNNPYCKLCHLYTLIPYWCSIQGRTQVGTVELQSPTPVKIQNAYILWTSWWFKHCTSFAPQPQLATEIGPRLVCLITET